MPCWGRGVNVHTLLQTPSPVYLALKHLQNVHLVVLVTTGDLRSQEDLWTWAQSSRVIGSEMQPYITGTSWLHLGCLHPISKAKELCVRPAWIQQVYWCQLCSTRKPWFGIHDKDNMQTRWPSHGQVRNGSVSAEGSRTGQCCSEKETDGNGVGGTSVAMCCTCCQSRQEPPGGGCTKFSTTHSWMCCVETCRAQTWCVLFSFPLLNK